MNQEIKRDRYLDKCIKRMGNGLIKVITGIRRCGKSYLLNPLFKTHLLSSGVKEDHIIEMAFDTRENVRFQNPDLFDDWVNHQIKDAGTYYLLLDEIQLLGNFEAVLNGFLRKNNIDVYVTGSNARFLSEDVITEFRGRGDEIHMAPLSFSEFMSVFPGDKRDGLNAYMRYGGLPRVVLAPDEEQKMLMLEALLRETYLTDIINRHHIKKPGEMAELLDILSLNIGSLTNPLTIVHTFHSVKKSTITPATISRYLGYLSDSYLIEFAKRYDVKGKKYIETPKKYYFSDLGLRNSRIHFRQIEPSHSMENIIYNERRTRGFNVDVGVVPVSGKNRSGSMVRK